jgi:acetyltransferase-like isoleucine patch superfamily enzyme
MVGWLLRARPLLGAYVRLCRLGVALGAAGMSVGENTRFLGVPCVAMVPGSAVSIGSRCVLISRGSLTALGTNHACMLRTLTADAAIVLGDDVGMSGGSICAARRVEIGSRTLLGANVTIMDTDFHEVDAVPRRYDHASSSDAAVTIGEDVFLGANVIVLKGVTIGNGTVVGAGSVVARSLPANVVAAGCPAKVLRPVAPGDARMGDPVHLGRP